MPQRYKFLNWPLLEPDSEGIITYSIGNFTPDLDPKVTIEAIEAAIIRWQVIMDDIAPKGNYIRFRKSSDFRAAKVKIVFLPPNKRVHTFELSDGSLYTHRTDWPLDGPQGVLAQVPYGSHTIEMDEGEQWSIQRAFKEYKGAWTLYVDIGEVVEHELGHVQDIAHTVNPIDTMFPSYDINVFKSITEDSRTAIALRFGKVKQKIKDNAKNTTEPRWQGIEHFKPHEFHSPDIKSGGAKMNMDFINRLNCARELADIPFRILSGYRTPGHNQRVGGVEGSSHLIGRAADIKATDSRERSVIINGLLLAGFTRLGIDRYFIHVDDDPDKEVDVVWLYDRSMELKASDSVAPFSGMITKEMIDDSIEVLEKQKLYMPAGIGSINWPGIVSAVIDFMKAVRDKMFTEDGEMKKPGLFRRLLFGLLTNMIWAFVRRVVSNVKGGNLGG